MIVIAVVGMAGSGKSEVARIFEQNGFSRVRFGDITDIEISKRGLTLNEENERQVRQQLRKEYGMAAYAILSLPLIEKSLQISDVVVDGLYSWEEYLLLKKKYSVNFKVIAVYSSPTTRYKRLSHRLVRPLTYGQARGRDSAEIENLNKGGPIAMADFTIINESSFESMVQQTERILAVIK